ncbi:MAG TPA: ABC transporter permease subunit [Candidatus Limnocylindrales bacterium]|nr:ABC transporter permease subunit [Candidatus Limnocylindrales bacterium]
MTAAVLSLGRSRLPGSRGLWLAALAIASAVLYVAFAGQWTLPHDNDAPTFERFLDLRSWVDANRNSNIVLVVVVTAARTILGALYEGLYAVLAAASWPGLTAIGAAAGLLVGGWRLAALMATGFLSFGVLGLWERSVETLALTLAAVAISLAIGIPIGILAGRSDRFYGAIRPILDAMQIMPTFAYLAPITMFFLIGPTSAAVVTVIYAMPPAIRITALGIRGVAPASVEAARSLGATGRQLLAKVQLPMARRTIVLAINQTIMMALSMVVITALVDAPGLGKNILGAIVSHNVGRGFDAGLAIVIMAIMLDRFTTQVSERLDPGRPDAARPTVGPWLRRIAIGGALAVTAAAVALGVTEFPEDLNFSFAGPVNSAVDWISLNLFFATFAFKEGVTYALINPLEHVFTTAPWWLVTGVIAGIALLIGGLRLAIITLVCLLGIVALEMWEHSMETLVQVLVAMILTLVIGVALGILAARSDRFSAVLRPLLDFAQTMPAFVYLLPAVALFLAVRFTGIVAAVIYAIPPVVRLVEIGIRTVPPAVREAGVSSGATPLQLLRKVELPVALPALLVAVNQGIVMVLAMVVVGGLVGAGGLGYDVVAGFQRRDFFGEGLAAAIAIVLLGIMLDRITQSAGSQRRAAAGAAVGHAA